MTRRSSRWLSAFSAALMLAASSLPQATVGQSPDPWERVWELVPPGLPGSCEVLLPEEQTNPVPSLAQLECLGSDGPEKIDDVGIFLFEDRQQLRQWWKKRTKRIAKDTGVPLRDGDCKRNTQGLESIPNGELICYKQSGDARVRWIDEESLLYGSLDTDWGKIAWAYDWWSKNIGSEVATGTGGSGRGTGTPALGSGSLWATGYSVTDLATDADGNVYILESTKDRVSKLDPRGRRLASWPVNGGVALAVSPSGEVYLWDPHGGRVRVLVDGQVARKWPVRVDGPAWRGGIAVGPDGHVYVAGVGYHLAVFDRGGRPLDEWRVDRWQEYERQATGDPGVVQPIDVAVGPQGNVYVADSYLGVHAFAPAGTELGSWSIGKFANDDSITGLSVGPKGLAMVSTYDGPVDRHTTDGGFLGSWGGPGGWGWEDREWPGDYAEYGYMASDLEGPVGATTFAPDGTLYADTNDGIMRVPVGPTRVDPGRSTLNFAPDSPRFIPAGEGDAALVADLKDGTGATVIDEVVQVVARPSSGAVGSSSEWRPCEPMLGSDALQCSISAPWTLGGWDVRLVSSATGATLAGPVRLETTRKVVVLVQGFNSALKKRFCYWGPTRTGKRDCESSRKRVLSDPKGVYGKLVSLGFTADRKFGDPGATILDMGWEFVPCGDAECVAEVSHRKGDVAWKARPYDIGWVRAPTSISRQLEIDRYAAALIETLKRYDQALANPDKGIGAHTSFHLVGHSMGGELVVRALNAAQADPYYIDQQHRGLIRTVISVDGALNWANMLTDFTAIPYPDVGTFVGSGKGIKHCGFPAYTKPGARKEVENANAVQLANKLMGTKTIALTNGNDWVVPYDPELVDLPVALLESPANPTKPGYRSQLFWGYGKGDAADPNCGHSTLLREQPGGLYTSGRWNDKGVNPKDYRAKSKYPLGGLFEKHIGSAVWEGR